MSSCVIEHFVLDRNCSIAIMVPVKLKPTQDDNESSSISFCRPNRMKTAIWGETMLILGWPPGAKLQFGRKASVGTFAQLLCIAIV